MIHNQAVHQWHARKKSAACECYGWLSTLCDWPKKIILYQFLCASGQFKHGCSTQETLPWRLKQGSILTRGCVRRRNTELLQLWSHQLKIQSLQMARKWWGGDQDTEQPVSPDTSSACGPLWTSWLSKPTATQILLLAKNKAILLVAYFEHQ